MSLVLIATPAASNANSYETVAEAQDYFDSRLTVAEWDNAASQDALLVMATRVLDMMFRPHRSLMRDACNCQYYLTDPQWTGTPATATQRLAWPRLGMFDQNGNSLDFTVTGISIASPTVITTDRPHGRITGDVVVFINSNSTPSIDGARTVTVLSTTTFSIPVAVTIAGTLATMTFMPQALKDALAELAGQLAKSDTTLDNDVRIQGITSVKAGSVAVTFKKEIDAHVIPDAVINLMPASWLTDELIEYALRAEFDVI